MSSTDEIGIGDETAKCRRVIALDASGNAILEGEEIAEARPGQAVFEREPDPLTRIEFRCVGRLEEQGHIGGQRERGELVSASVINYEDIEAVRARTGEIVEKGLKLSAVERQPRLEKPSPVRGATAP